jgi:hypothetical protein
VNWPIASGENAEEELSETEKKAVCSWAKKETLVKEETIRGR